MGRPFPGELADPHRCEARARKAVDTHIALDAHIRAIEAAAGKLTPEQAERLRSLLPAPADEVTRTSDLHVVVAGVLVTLAVIGLAGFMVVRLSGTTPAVIAAVFTAFAAVLAAIPSIIKALRGS